ncbi:hypothetical protein N7299_07000 [Stenotrophomonas maltophilia]|uniref:hypothetical protein n=1 Tax=Stenotrophomonas maltophilia TaxID=40324 RepID=UPI00209B3397|nr:hypothetical protein [Stenotrophomonas maltophilia]MCO7497531.1 hypothetical protein [Stenotrophomonas maltophilia]MDH0072538.1 hypothetical protein [Stenotrophomonas maltophilia]MDH0105882.1 hypothetical protein [Stenotrophomonas maltophilia]MDH0742548.1 hypothetical protein [Stenotrophomonas maltophilia]MDH1116916.1 hypothetical protein [Stenotrophomonas maltophilia]
MGSIPIARSMSPAVCIRQTLRDIRTPLFRAWILVEMPGECLGWTSLRKHPLAGSVESECILAQSLQDRNCPAAAAAAVASRARSSCGVQLMLGFAMLEDRQLLTPNIRCPERE